MRVGQLQLPVMGGMKKRNIWEVHTAHNYHVRKARVSSGQVYIQERNWVLVILMGTPLRWSVGTVTAAVRGCRVCHWVGLGNSWGSSEISQEVHYRIWKLNSSEVPAGPMNEPHISTQKWPKGGSLRLGSIWPEEEKESHLVKRQLFQYIQLFPVCIFTEFSPLKKIRPDISLKGS